MRLVFVLIDARRGAQEEEQELLEWLVECGIPAVVIMTKCDKLGKSKRKPAAMAMKRSLELARPPIMTSAQTNDGLADLWQIISSMT